MRRAGTEHGNLLDDSAASTGPPHQDCLPAPLVDQARAADDDGEHARSTMRAGPRFPQ
ncbi:hypothetical protein MMMB2_1991 [Mycobacterium marinum MB2]|nr:hypothetical protein MMMB2_1991 [Mycobacterium marinum MB2]